MNGNYFGKLIFLGLALSFQLPLFGVALCTAIGHILDIRHKEIIAKITRAFKYQKNSDDFIFMIAYFCYFLGLDNKKAQKDLPNVTLLKPEANALDLFNYYYEIKIPKLIIKKSLNDTLDNKIANLKTFLKEDTNEYVSFFAIIEFLFNKQDGYKSIEHIARLKDIASIFNIDYQANYSFNGYDKYEEPKQQKYYHKEEYYSNENNNSNYEQKEYEEPTKPYDNTPQDVKDACNFFGLDINNLDLSDVKKIYKKRAMKVHPDIIRAQNLSEKKIKQADNEMLNLNKYMDIIKKYLANS